MSEANLAAADSSASAEQPRLYGLIAEFSEVEPFVRAARQVRQEGFRRWDAHSPFPIHGMDPAMGIRHTRLPWLVFVFGVIGCISGVSMQWWMNATDPQNWSWVPTFLQGYDYVISGKPMWSLPANIPVIFETTVLLAALAAVVGMLALNGLPRWHHPLFSSHRFLRVTSDRFFLCIEARDARFDENETAAFLQSLGGSAVERVYWPPATPRPRWIPIGTLIIACLAVFPPILVYKLNVAMSPEPRIHIIPNMDNQPRYKAQMAGPFNDQRAMRPPVPGTIARQDDWALGNDPHFYEGRVSGAWATTFPSQLEISVPFIRRGQERFEVNCAVCHGLDGAGNGIVNQRVRDKSQISSGWVPPTSLTDQTVRDRSVGHIFNSITNGIRTMPPYKDQISVADRWAIVAYVRALQRSQHADVADVPEDKRSELR